MWRLRFLSLICLAAITVLSQTYTIDGLQVHYSQEGGELAPLVDDEEQPVKKRGLIARGMARVRSLGQRFTRFLRRMASLLRARSVEEKVAEFRSMEEAAFGHLKCFSRASPENRAQAAIDAVCASMDTRDEWMRRLCSIYALHIADKLDRFITCLDTTSDNSIPGIKWCARTHGLFYVHPYLQPQSRIEDIQSSIDVTSWFQNLKFVTPSVDEVMEGLSPLQKALAVLNLSAYQPVDSVHVEASKLLKASIRRRVGLARRISNVLHRRRSAPTTYTIPDAAQIIDTGRKLLESIPPHSDPLAIRLTTVMLRYGLDCEKAGLPNRKVQLTLGDKTVKVTRSKMAEAAILATVEVLFDGSHCALESADLDDLRCKVLHSYDEALQKGIITVQTGTEEETPEGEALSEGVPTAFMSIEGSEEEVESAEPPETVRRLDLDESADVARSDADEKAKRILQFSTSATANAVALAELSLKSSTRSARIISILLGNSFVVRKLVELILRFGGKTFFSDIDVRPFMKAQRTWKVNYLGMYVKAEILMVSGSRVLSRVAETVATAVLKREIRNLERAARTTSSSLLQVQSAPTAFERLLDTAGINVEPEVARGVETGLTIAFYTLLVIVLALLGITAPLGASVAYLLAVILLLMTLMNLYYFANPPTA